MPRLFVDIFRDVVKQRLLQMLEARGRFVRFRAVHVCWSVGARATYRTAGCQVASVAVGAPWGLPSGTCGRAVPSGISRIAIRSVNVCRLE